MELLDLEQIEQRIAEIRSLNFEEMDINAINEINQELDQLQERKATLKQEAESKKEIRTKILNGEVETEIIEKPMEGRKMNKFENMTKEEVLSTQEYRKAFLKTALGHELSEGEKRAASYVYTTGTNSAPLPKTMVDEIWDLIGEEHAILNDVTTYRTGTILELVKVTSIAQGKGKKVAEGEENDDFKTVEVKVTLTGNDYSAVVELSYAQANMSIDAFEQYLKNKIVEQVSIAMVTDLLTEVKGSINSANKVTAKAAKLAYTDITSTFAKLKRCKSKVVYVNNATLYDQLCGMVDLQGRPIFQPNAQDDAEGTLLGAKVKVEDGLGEGELLVGDPKRVVGNVVTDLLLESDKDIKAHKLIHSAYARAEYELMDDLSFALLTPAA